MSDVSPELRGRTIDGFRVECLLGRGGMGAVWKAWDTRLERQVALKVLAGARDAADAARFEREAKAVSGVSHPNVAHVYATGRVDGCPYYVMELVEGRSLARLVEEEGRLPGRRALELLLQAAEGLAAARAKGVVHRDVKPDNLMVGHDGVLKLVDFGLARRVEATDASLTDAGMVVGTPRYMAPEQATGAPVDHRSDLYALGATFYHAFSGQAPFEAPTPVAVMMKHVNEPLVPLREKVPDLPPGVSAIVDRMMAKAPERRYQTWDELVVDVKRALLRDAAPRAAGPTVALPTPARPRAARSAPAAEAEPPSAGWKIAVAAGGALAVVLFLAYRAGRDLNAPAPAAAPAPASGARAGRAGGAAAGVVPGGLGTDFGASGIAMAWEAKSLAHLRKIATALAVIANEESDTGLPQRLDELTRDDRFGIHPTELRDGWGRPIRYERIDAFHFRLRSDGADGVPGGGDDLVMEDGVVVQGGPRPR